MDELTARLEALFRRYAVAYDRRAGVAVLGRFGPQFRKDMDLVIAEYGQAAVDVALDAMPNEAWPSIALH